METLTGNKNIFSPHKLQPLLCSGKQLLYSLFSQVGLWLNSRVEIMRSSASETSSDSKITRKLKAIARLLLAHVDLGAVVNTRTIAKRFPRFAVGLCLLVWVAPAADVLYTKFDINDRVSADVWYYESWNWFFLSTGPYLKSFFQTIGLYLCLVYKPSVIKTLVICWCLMYDIGKLIWLVQVENHDEYEMVTPTMFLTYAFFTGAFLVKILDLLVWWMNHRWEAFKRRLQGVALIADKAEPQVIVKSFVETMEYGNNVEQFNQ